MTNETLEELASRETVLEAAITASEHVQPEDLAAGLYPSIRELEDARDIGFAAATAAFVGDLARRREIAAQWLKMFRRENAPALLTVIDGKLGPAQTAADECKETQEAACLANGLQWQPNPRWETLNRAAGEMGHVRHQVESLQAGARAVIALLAVAEPSPADDEALATADQAVQRFKRRVG